MNSFISVVNTFDALQKKGWMKVGDEDDIFIPNCPDISIKCIGDSNRYPIWLLSLNHYLIKDYCNNNYKYYVETDRYNNILRLLVYKEQIIVLKKNLINLDKFEELISNNLSKLALIYSNNKIERKQHYYRYNEMKLLKLRGIDTFLKLLNTNIIKIKITSNSIRFLISKRDLEKLYKIEYSYDNKLKSFLSFLDK